MTLAAFNLSSQELQDGIDVACAIEDDWIPNELISCKAV
jgi:hypothetical protein